jgi:ubiquinone/menaquinone biosynthesis C-methylase UbiE/glycosyltransferase involved in cell wall biosynthesis
MNRKICFITESFSTDKTKNLIGAAAQTYMLAKGFLDKDWEVHLVSSTKQKYKNNTTEIFEGIHVYWWKRSKFLGVFDYLNIIRILKSINAKVYYTRGRSILVTAIVKAAKSSNAITLWASNGQDGCQKYVHIKRLFQKKKNFLIKILALPNAIILDIITHNGIKNVDIYFTQTKIQQDDLKKYFKRDSKIIKSGYYIPLNSIIKPSPPVILYLSRLTPTKQPQFFIELANRLKHLDCIFKIAGKIHPLLEKILIPKIYKNDKIKYVGNVAFLESIKLVEEASILVNTSMKEGEGLSNSMVLAWLNSVPTITLESDPDNIVKDNKLGFTSGTFEQLVKDVEYLIINTDKRNEIGKHSAEFAKKEFDIYIIVDKIINEINNYIILNGMDIQENLDLKREESIKIAGVEMKKSFAEKTVHKNLVKHVRNESNKYLYNYVIKIASKFFNDNTKTILDAGAGTAEYSIHFAKLGYRVVAVDISEAVLEMAAEEINKEGFANSIHLKSEDIINFAFDDESFDYIYCWGVLMHIPEIEKAIKELSRILKPGGKMIISVSNKFSIHNMMFRFYRKIIGDRREITETKYGTEIISDKSFGKIFTRIFNIRQLKKIFNEYGIYTVKRLPGQVTELYVKYQQDSFRHKFFQLINKFWIKVIGVPYLCYGNILLLQKNK